MASLQRNVRCVYCLSLLSGFATAHTYFLAQHQLALLGSAKAVGTLVTLAALAQVLVEIPSGLLADAFGRKPTLIAATLCRLAGVSVLTVAGQWQYFATAAVLDAIAGALVSGTDSALLWDSLCDNGARSPPPGKFEHATAVAHTLWPCAAAMAAIMGGWVSLPAALLGSQIMLLVALAVCGLIREPARLAMPKETRGVATRAILSGAQVLTATWRSLQNPHMVVLLAVGAATHAFGDTPHRFRALFYTTRGVTRAQAGMLSACGLACGSLGSLSAAPLRTRIGARPLLTTALAGMAACLLAASTMYSDGPAAPPAWIISSGGLWILGSNFAWALHGPIMAGLVHAEAPAGARATLSSVLVLTRKLGLAAWAPAVAALTEATSIDTAYAVCGAGLLATSGFLAAWGMAGRRYLY